MMIPGKNIILQIEQTRLRMALAEREADVKAVQLQKRFSIHVIYHSQKIFHYVMNKLYNSFHPLLFWFGECLFVWLSVSDFLLFAPNLADVGHNF